MDQKQGHNSALHASAARRCRWFFALLDDPWLRFCRQHTAHTPTYLARRFLDRRVLPGVNKLSWGAPKHQTDFYTRDALRCCKEVAAAVAELKAGSAAVAATCGLFREAALVRVERKRLYDLPDFEQRQAAHQVSVRMVCEVYVCLNGQLPVT